MYICSNPAKTNAFVSGDTSVLVVQLFMHLLYRKTACTVQIFNSCTSPPDVCQCLVVQTSTNNIQI